MSTNHANSDTTEDSQLSEFLNLENKIGKDFARYILRNEYHITDENITDKVLSSMTDTVLSAEDLMRSAINASLKAMGILYPCLD